MGEDKAWCVYIDTPVHWACSVHRLRKTHNARSGVAALVETGQGNQMRPISVLLFASAEGTMNQNDSTLERYVPQNKNPKFAEAWYTY